MRCRRAVLALVLAAACGPRDHPGVIRFWGLGFEGERVVPLIREFEREHPGIRVEVQQVPWTAAHEKLVTSHVGNASPDVAQLGNTWIAEFVALNAVAPLDSFIARSDVVDAEAFFPGIWDANVVADTVWGVPWYVDTRVLFYRTDLMARAGFEQPPGTWAEWREAMRAIKALDGPDGYGMFFPTNEWTQPVILGMQAGSPLLAGDGERGLFSEPEFRRGFTFYIDTFREGLAPVASNTELANVHQEFERGLFGMYITGPWQLSEFRTRLSRAAQDLWDTAPLPGPDGPGSGISLAGGASLVMFRSSEKKDAAWALIEFLSRPEIQARFYELVGDLPAREEAWEAPVLRDDPRAEAFRIQLERVRPLPRVPEWEQIATRVLDHADIAARGAVTIDEALANLDRDVNRILAKRRWILDRKAEQR